ncbi:hypothetical protein A2Z33_06380 [Candidatus Gottesmanbacteria bacterium RBG_16_52_11]|uniref:Multidrug ABC transporter substrate-binding protein n=1 Tax=Candidatus Gottesmanbacteria bacterium RBG_16_52_11 TaxID=1798374 RepID=A0A1F5YY55_9BACT|nr:MAG: hypothetical protein A2Z33_06380 [Candidatus Gottesmanbacteria bacterium RBG_16_52_11]
MEYSEIVTDALGNLTVNKMRTGLAVLGIIIGIGSVIALVSLGQGSQKAVTAQIQSLGSNLLTVVPSGGQSGGVRQAAGSGTNLTSADAEAILNSPAVTTVKNVSPEYTDRIQVTAGRNNTNTMVLGVTPQYLEVRKTELSSGTFITARDNEAQAKVAVLGPQAVTDLFGEGAAAVGQSVRINGQAMRVIGVTTSRGGSGFQNQDDRIYVPLSTAQKLLFGTNYVNQIAVEANSEDVMTQAQDEIGYLLLARHRLSDPSQADFFIMSQNDILNTASSVTGTFTALLSGIAAISLVVGGIGIMNIMLVTVTERTREIGLRKALGARKRHIITQFLLESVILTAVGGTFGIAFGIAVSYIIARVISMPFTIAVSSVALAIGVSGGIGIIFGWYPARLASNLQPIEALRYE